MTIPIWQALLLTVLAAVCAQRRVVGWIYLFQLDEYQPSRIWRTARRRFASNWRWQLGLAVGALAMAVVATQPAPLPRAIPLGLAALLVLGTDRPFERRGELRWTSRAKELEALAAALLLLALFSRYGAAGRERWFWALSTCSRWPLSASRWVLAPLPRVGGATATWPRPSI